MSHFLDLLQNLFFHVRMSADLLPCSHDASLFGAFCQLFLVGNHKADHVVLFTARINVKNEVGKGLRKGSLVSGFSVETLKYFHVLKLSLKLKCWKKLKLSLSCKAGSISSSKSAQRKFRFSSSTKRSWSISWCYGVCIQLKCKSWENTEKMTKMGLCGGRSGTENTDSILHSDLTYRFVDYHFEAASSALRLSQSCFFGARTYC